MSKIPVGQISQRVSISNISNGIQCQVTTSSPQEFETNDFIRLTDLNSCMPSFRGMDQINNKLFLIEVTSPTTFYIKNSITFEYIDSTFFTPYVSGGSANVDPQTFNFYPPVDQSP